MQNNILPKHIKKGHQLVFSRQDLSAREADLFALVVAFMKPTDWDHKTPQYEFACANLAQWLNIESKHVGFVLTPTASRLSERRVGIKDDSNGEFDFIPLFKRMKYAKGVLTIIPNDELKNEYIAYNQGFALINTANFLGLKREYSKRLYELLSRFKGGGGTKLKAQSIIELKGLFGILDESDKLKIDKKSFSNTSVFMQRCIRESITELMENTNTKKDIMFLPGNDKNFGFTTLKAGKRITSVEFLYHWIDKDAENGINQKYAEDTIKNLELKRLTSKIKLPIVELKDLAAAYIFLGKTVQGERVLESVNQREKEPESENEEVIISNIDSILEKINQLKEIQGDIEY